VHGNENLEHVLSQNSATFWDHALGDEIRRPGPRAGKYAF
jgi:hypothetical protein